MQRPEVQTPVQLPQSQVGATSPTSPAFPPARSRRLASSRRVSPHGRGDGTDPKPRGQRPSIHLHQTISNPSETPVATLVRQNAVSRPGGEAEDVSVNDLTASSSLRTAGGAWVRQGVSLGICPILQTSSQLPAPRSERSGIRRKRRHI